MATLRGHLGFVSVGGYLFGGGSLVVAGAVAAGGSAVNVVQADTANIFGVIAPGDTFTVNGVAGTYTVVSLRSATDPHRVKHWEIILGGASGITFTPVAPVGGFPDAAAITFTQNVLTQVRLWRLTQAFQLLDTTVMGQVARTRRTGRLTKDVVLELLFDRGEAGQAAILNTLQAGGALGYAFVVLGNRDSRQGFTWLEDCERLVSTQQYFFAESCALQRALIISERGGLALMRVDALSHERRLQVEWAEACEPSAPPTTNSIFIEECEPAAPFPYTDELYTELCEA